MNFSKERKKLGLLSTSEKLEKLHFMNILEHSMFVLNDQKAGEQALSKSKDFKKRIAKACLNLQSVMWQNQMWQFLE